MPEKKNIKGWDAIAQSYQRDHLISLEDVHFGPLIPGERDLQLIADVENKSVLDVGCGGGQNAVVLAKWGARVTAVEPSQSQLEYARELCRGVENVHLVRSRGEELTAFRKESFDVVFSALSLDFVTDIEETFRQAWRILKAPGRLVFSIIHPIMNCAGWYLMGDRQADVVENYFEMKGARTTMFDFEDGTKSGLDHYRHTFGELFAFLAEQGFVLTALCEPRPYDLTLIDKDQWSRVMPYCYKDLDLESPFYQLLQNIPYTLIVQACKPGPRSKEIS